MLKHLKKIIFWGLLTMLFIISTYSQQDIKRYKYCMKTIEENWRIFYDSSNKHAQFCSIDTSFFIHYNRELEPIKGKFVVDYCHKLDRVFKKQNNKIVKSNLFITVVSDQNYKYFIISEESNKKNNDVKIRQGDTLTLKLSNIFGYKLFFCTNTPNYKILFDFIYKDFYFNHFLIQSYYISDEIFGCYIDKSKVNPYLMRSCIEKRNSDIYYFNYDIDKKAIYKNWEKLNMNGVITVLNSTDPYTSSEFYERRDTLFAKFKIEYIWKTVVYKKGIVFLSPLNYYKYILSLDGINYAVYSPTKIKNKTTMTKYKVGEDVELKIVNIFPIKGSYRLVNNYPQYISFISHNLYFKNVLKNPYYYICE